MRKKGFIVLGMVTALFFSLAGCGSKKEAVIVDNNDETTAQDQKETLAVSNEAKFSYDDLCVGRVKYLMTEQDVKGILGEPDKVESSDDKSSQKQDNSDDDEQSLQNIDEKLYSYKNLTLIFSKIDNEYKLTSASSADSGETFSRDIRVGDDADKILSKYFREQNCMNDYYYSDDQTALMGNMLYGNFTIDDLDKVKTDGKVEYGVINYNGYDSLDTAESYIIEFTYSEPPYINGTATTDDNFAQIAFDIDSNKKITSIRWYYYPKIQN